MVRKISGNVPSTTVHHLIDKNTRITDITEIANTLGKTFANISSTDHYTAEFLQVKRKAEEMHTSFTSDNSEPYNLPITMVELEDALRNTSESSPGPDNIHYQFLKQLPVKSLQLLLLIFNNIYDDGIFPPIWQQATVVPIPKPDKDRTDACSYRPIALTSCICKTMERIVNTRLVYYLEANGCISDVQSGFRKQRSTTDHLVRLESSIREGLANGEHVVVVFFDLEKAYDTSWRHGTLLDMYRAGLRGRLLVFVSKFLQNRHFRVRIGSTYSDFF
jgi:potassium voltage-gated channel Eag-related subfamily H protein 8